MTKAAKLLLIAAVLGSTTASPVPPPTLGGAERVYERSSRAAPGGRDEASSLAAREAKGKGKLADPRPWRPAHLKDPIASCCEPVRSPVEMASQRLGLQGRDPVIMPGPGEKPQVFHPLISVSGGKLPSRRKRSPKGPAPKPPAPPPAPPKAPGMMKQMAPDLLSGGVLMAAEQAIKAKEKADAEKAAAQAPKPARKREAKGPVPRPAAPKPAPPAPKPAAPAPAAPKEPGILKQAAPAMLSGGILMAADQALKAKEKADAEKAAAAAGKATRRDPKYGAGVMKAAAPGLISGGVLMAADQALKAANPPPKPARLRRSPKGKGSGPRPAAPKPAPPSPPPAPKGPGIIQQAIPGIVTGLTLKAAEQAMNQPPPPPPPARRWEDFIELTSRSDELEERDPGLWSKIKNVFKGTPAPPIPAPPAPAPAQPPARRGVEDDDRELLSRGDDHLLTLL